MPLYEYQCAHCQRTMEHIVPYEERGNAIICYHCGNDMHAVLTVPKIGRARHETAIVTSKGETIKGTFGKTYRTDTLKKAKRKATK